MTKEIRCKCKLCGAKHRESFMLHFQDKKVCNDCAYEYRKIFFNYQNRKDRKAKENPFFKAFERGWLAEEAEKGLQHREIPQFMKDDYQRLWEIDRAKWRSMIDSDEAKDTLKEFKFNTIKRINDGISESS